VPENESLHAFSVRQAEAAWDAGDASAAAEWLDGVPADLRPAHLTGPVQYQLARDAAQAGEWSSFIRRLETANRAAPSPLFQRRLGLARRRRPLMDNRYWLPLLSKRDPAVRLTTDSLAPDVSGVWSCGAYHAWGSARAMPWSVLLRLAKGTGSASSEEIQAAVNLACGFLARYLVEETGALLKTDVVAAVPANPSRFVGRGFSLPDALCRAAEEQLALPFEFAALRWGGRDTELRGLTRQQRREAVVGTIRRGDLGLGEGRSVLLVDDVMTSGATLREGARILREMGAQDIYAITMSHTEG
jgi:adenine/guanine phosphoribosyltransferase-like PRPP-binding protein